MSVYVKMKFKAPKLVEYLKEIGIDISVHNDVFIEGSSIKLASGLTACLFDEDAWGETLYGPQEMGLPRSLGGIGFGGSFVVWLLQHLTDVGDNDCSDGEGFYDEDCDYEFYDEEFGGQDNENSMAFCREAKEIIENKFSGNDIWKKIAELDDLIDEAEILYLSYWGGNDFDYSYAQMKNNESSYWEGNGFDDDPFEDWYWRNLDEFIVLVKENVTCTTYKRKKSKWVKG